MIVSPPKSNQRLWKSESRYGCDKVNGAAQNGGVGAVEPPRTKYGRWRGWDPLERDCEFGAGEIEGLAREGPSRLAGWTYGNALDVFITIVGVGSWHSRQANQA